MEICSSIRVLVSASSTSSRACSSKPNRATVCCKWSIFDAGVSDWAELIHAGTRGFEGALLKSMYYSALTGREVLRHVCFVGVQRKTKWLKRNPCCHQRIRPPRIALSVFVPVFSVWMESNTGAQLLIYNKTFAFSTDFISGRICTVFTMRQCIFYISPYMINTISLCAN